MEQPQPVNGCHAPKAFSSIRITAFGRIKAAGIARDLPETVEAINDPSNDAADIAAVLESEYGEIYPLSRQGEIHQMRTQVLAALQCATM